jgi:succinate dehydrogenase flavin-adding protein (antitoxin of CptAB toxin-antitoxin module)
MRELDLLLEKFLAPGLDSLGENDLDRLERLLQESDQDILAWLSGTAKPQDSDMNAIVTIVRSRIES